MFFTDSCRCFLAAGGLTRGAAFSSFASAASSAAASAAATPGCLRPHSHDRNTSGPGLGKAGPGLGLQTIADWCTLNGAKTTSRLAPPNAAQGEDTPGSRPTCRGRARGRGRAGMGGSWVWDFGWNVKGLW
jgi:hypothetical protein